MLPSQFLNVVLEEGEGDAKTEFSPEPSPKKDGSKVAVQKMVQKHYRSKIKSPKTFANNNILLEGLELSKKLPAALLTECTVEVFKGPVVRKPLPEPKFEVRILPVYNKANHAKVNGTEHWKDIKYLPFNESKNKKEDDANMEVVVPVDALSEVEAVYSEHESDSELDVSEFLGSSVDDKNSPAERLKHLPGVQLSKVSDIKIEKGEADVSLKQVLKCKICSKSFGSMASLLQHSASAHSEQACPICNLKFSRNCNLALHLKSHLNENFDRADTAKTISRLKMWKCDLCDRGFTSWAALAYHTSQEHGDISHLENLTPSDPSALVQDRPHKCPFCGKCYSQKSVLKKHLVIHTGERLACQLCGIDFTQKSSLMRHVKRMHHERRHVAVRRRYSKLLPPLRSLHHTEGVKKSIPEKLPESDSENDDLASTESFDHFENLPEQTAEFIQSLKIPQGAP